LGEESDAQPEFKLTRRAFFARSIASSMASYLTGGSKVSALFGAGVSKLAGDVVVMPYSADRWLKHTGEAALIKRTNDFLRQEPSTSRFYNRSGGLLQSAVLDLVLFDWEHRPLRQPIDLREQFETVQREAILKIKSNHPDWRTFHKKRLEEYEKMYASDSARNPIHDLAYIQGQFILGEVHREVSPLLMQVISPLLKDIPRLAYTFKHLPAEDFKRLADLKKRRCKLKIS